MSSRTIAVAGMVLALALGLAACGSSGGGGGGGGGKTVDIYSSLPLQGASKDQTAALVNGIQLAVSQAGGKAGAFKIKYTSLDDSTAQAGNWDPGQTAQNARKVAQDSNAVYYIGEFNSGASKISIPILNQASIPQVSPANTYPGLTTSEPGTEKGEPDKYYPTQKRTYLRIVPRDKIQSAALLTQMKQDGCKKTALANDKETYGGGLARIFVQQAKAAGFTVTGNDGIDKSASNYRAYASKV
ncbi:MAG: branched-chain amino acid ABC transporter substrate-binding protein, partial [Actinobacteria bacterium]